jgi:hypothetical protein
VEKKTKLHDSSGMTHDELPGIDLGEQNRVKESLLACLNQGWPDSSGHCLADVEQKVE